MDDSIRIKPIGPLKDLHWTNFYPHYESIRAGREITHLLFILPLVNYEPLKSFRRALRVHNGVRLADLVFFILVSSIFSHAFLNGDRGERAFHSIARRVSAYIFAKSYISRAKITDASVNLSYTPAELYYGRFLR